MRGRTRLSKGATALWRLLILAGVLVLSLCSVVVSGRELGDGYGKMKGVTLASAGSAGTILAKAVQTGDDTPLLLYIMILLVAAAAVVLIWSIIKTKDRRKGRKPPRGPQGPGPQPPQNPQGDPRANQGERGNGGQMDPRMAGRNANGQPRSQMNYQGPRENQGVRTRAQDPRLQGGRRMPGQDMNQNPRMDRNAGMADSDEFFPNQEEQRPRTRARRRPEE